MASVSLGSLLIFTNQFSAMVTSHLPLVSVLHNLAKETPERGLRNAIEEIVDDVENGYDLGDALAEHPGMFDEVYVNVVRAGISSGKLGDALQHLSQHLENADLVHRKLRAALSYPFFVFFAFFVAFNGLVFFVLPRFEQIFRSFKKELPWPTQVLLQTADFWRENWGLIVLGIVVVIAAVSAWMVSAAGKLIWDEYKLQLPVLGPMWRMAALGRFLRTLGVQVRNEVEMLPALRLAAPASGNSFVEETILMVAEDIENGYGIAESFEAQQVFSGIVMQMISAGEEAGELDRLLISAADYFDRLLDNQLQIWTSLINPLLTVFIGIGIAGMMIAVFLPIFDMGQTAG